MWDLMGSLFSVVLALLGIILVLLLTYHVSRWYAAKLGPTAGGGRHIKIIDRVMVGKTGALLLVELSGTQYLVSVSERGAEILKELDEPVEAPEAPPMPVFGLKALDFRELLEKVGVRKGGM